MAKRASGWWQHSRKWFTRLEGHELTWLLIGLGGCILLLVVGLFWASLCWLVAQHYEVRAGIRAEKRKSAA